MAGLGVIRPAHAQTPVATPGFVRQRIPLLRIGVTSLANPHAMDAMWLSSLVYDTPFSWNSSGDLLPAIANFAVQLRHNLLGLQVRPGVMTPDGAAVSPRHLLLALDRIRATAPWRLDHVADMWIADGTLWLQCDRYDASLRATLAHPSSIVSVNGVGTGPFQRGLGTRMQAPYGRNPLFWQIERPHIDALQMMVIADDTQRSAAMATGELDVLPNVPLLDVPMLAAEPTVYLVGGPSNRLCYLQLNTGIAPLDDPLVRRILSAAIDRDALIATADQAEPATTLFPPDAWADEIDPLEALPADTVRESLRDLGLPSDIRLHLLMDNADATLANTAVVLQDQLANCGISLSITLLEGDELLGAIAAGDFDVLVGYSEPWRDPHELAWPLLATDGAENRSGYASTEVDATMRLAIALDDDGFRRSRYTRLEELIRRDVPVVPLFRPYVWDAVSTQFPGYAALPPVTSRGLMTLIPTEVG